MDKPPLADVLRLEPHPEGGWFRETYRSLTTFEPAGYDGPRAAATAILYLLEPGERSRWHVVASDELWLWHRGTLELTLGGDGVAPLAAETVILGPRIEDGEVPQVTVPRGVWQSARPTSDEAVLVSCVVAPGFDFADFRLADP